MLKNSSRLFKTLEEQHKWLVESMLDVVWIMSLDRKLLYVSPSVEKLRGYSVEEVLEQSFEQIVCESSRQIAIDALNELFLESKSLKSTINKTIVIEIPCKNSPNIWTETNVKLVYDENANNMKYVANTRDITKRIEAEKKVEEEKKLLNDILDLTNNIIFVTNFEHVSFYNKEFEKIVNEKGINLNNSFGILEIFEETKESLHMGLLEPNESFISLIKRTPEHKRQVSIFSNFEKLKTYNISISQTTYSGEYLVTLTDITKIKEEHVEVQRKAYHDVLTGVYNRNKFTEEINIEIEKAKRYGNLLSLVIMDIDHFKILNDTYGHLVGDEVLIMIANYINDVTRITDVFARWGGEEFVLLMTETSLNKAIRVVEKLKNGMGELKHEVAGRVTASFGITQYKLNDTSDTFFKRADDALYISKKEGRNKITFL